MVQLVSDCKCKLAEGPLWHPDENALYWLDIEGGALWRSLEGKSERVHEGEEQLGGALLHDDGSLLVFGERGRVHRWNGSSLELLIELPGECTRFNDAIATPEGDILTGTMPEEPGSSKLIRIAQGGEHQVLLSGLQLSNGMAFSPHGDLFYHTDSDARTITCYEWPSLAGHILHRVLEEGSVPDGMAADEHGNIWSARWGGGAVYGYDPLGRELARIEVPAEKASSVAFGGEDMKTLFITTAEGRGVFSTDMEVPGLPRYRSKLAVTARKRG